MLFNCKDNLATGFSHRVFLDIDIDKKNYTHKTRQAHWCVCIADFHRCYCFCPSSGNSEKLRQDNTSVSALDSSTGAGVTSACYKTTRNKFRPYSIILLCRQWWCETLSELFLLLTMAVFDDISIFTLAIALIQLLSAEPDIILAVFRKYSNKSS